jgi:hypothetical protein
MSMCPACINDDCDDEDVVEGRNTVCDCACHAPEPPLAIFWAIRNEKGEYFKTGTSSSSPRWVKDLGLARIYSKLGPARGKVTALANLDWNADNPIADIVEFVVNDVRVIDQKERVAKSQAKKAHKEADRKIRTMQVTFEDAQREFNEARARLNALKGPRVHDVDCGCKSCVGM